VGGGGQGSLATTQLISSTHTYRSVADQSKEVSILEAESKKRKENKKVSAFIEVFSVFLKALTNTLNHHLWIC